MVDALFQPFPMVAGRRAQVWRYQPQWPQYHKPRHFHEEPEINLVVRGQGMMGIGDRTRAVAAGDVLLFNPGQDHVLLHASDDFDLFNLALRPELADRAALPVVRATTTLQLGSAAVARVAAELLHLRNVTDPSCHEHCVTELFKKLQPPPAAAHVLSRRGLRSVVHEPQVSSATLARRLHTTASALSRRFHDDLGLTFVEHRARMRIIHFVRAVERGNDFATAAKEAHFGSYSQLHRVFRRTFGCSPSEYFAGGREVLNEATFMDVEDIRQSIRARLVSIARAGGPAGVGPRSGLAPPGRGRSPR